MFAAYAAVPALPGDAAPVEGTAVVMPAVSIPDSRGNDVIDSVSAASIRLPGEFAADAKADGLFSGADRFCAPDCALLFWDEGFVVAVCSVAG